MLALTNVPLVLITLFFVLYVLNKNKNWRNAVLDFKYCALVSSLDRDPRKDFSLSSSRDTS